MQDFGKRQLPLTDHGQIDKRVAGDPLGRSRGIRSATNQQAIRQPLLDLAAGIFDALLIRRQTAHPDNSGLLAADGLLQAFKCARHVKIKNRYGGKSLRADIARNGHQADRVTENMTVLFYGGDGGIDEKDFAVWTHELSITQPCGLLKDKLAVAGGPPPSLSSGKRLVLDAVQDELRGTEKRRADHGF